MNTIAREQTTTTLTRLVRGWDRRLRLVRSTLWVPRGVILGLALGVAIAGASRLRPWLLPEQIALITGSITLGLLLIAAGWIWARPHSSVRMARYFDRRFALQERVSTALELTSGAIAPPPGLADRQLSDAVRSAQGVRAATWLPIRLRWLELAVMLLLGGALAALLLAENPQTQELLAERDLTQAIETQAAALERQIQAIEQNDALTPEEREALAEPLREALDILQQEEVTQQEAVAAMAEAQQSLRDMTDGMLADQQQAYREAASELAGSEMTSELAQTLNQGDLGAAADAADRLARELGSGELSQEEMDDLANRLDGAAEALAETNPALAEQLREAAEALREGDVEQAQEALRDAAEALREQQEQLENSPLAEEARDAAERAREGQQAIAQAGQEPPGEQQAQAGQQAGEQPGSASESENEQTAGAEQSPGAQESQAGQQGQSGEQQGAEAGDGAQQAQSGEGQQPGEGEAAGAQQAEQGQPGAEGAPGEAQGEEAPASGQQPGAQPGGSQPGEGQAQPDAAVEGEPGAAAAAGQGEGGAGNDTTQGSAAGGEIPADSASTADQEGQPQEFNPEFAPSDLEGQSSDPIDIGGDIRGEDTIPGREGEFSENPTGESNLSYQSVYGNYQDYISDALESGRIPLDQRDVIHDYFSSLEP